jgi:hypothetical protein
MLMGVHRFHDFWVESISNFTIFIADLLVTLFFKHRRARVRGTSEADSMSSEEELDRNPFFVALRDDHALFDQASRNRYRAPKLYIFHVFRLNKFLFVQFDHLYSASALVGAAENRSELAKNAHSAGVAVLSGRIRYSYRKMRHDQR